jgi:hypothetical protein
MNIAPANDAMTFFFFHGKAMLRNARQGEDIEAE